MGAGGSGSVPASSFAVVSVSVSAARPRSVPPTIEKVELLAAKLPG